MKNAREKINKNKAKIILEKNNYLDCNTDKKKIDFIAKKLGLI